MLSLGRIGNILSAWSKLKTKGRGRNCSQVWQSDDPCSRLGPSRGKTKANSKGVFWCKKEWHG